MNRKEFQEWLDNFPEDTEIKVALQEVASEYHPYGAVNFYDFKAEQDQYHYAEYFNNPYIKEDSAVYGKSVLYLGDAQ